MWKRHGEFGQFIDIEKEEIIIHGSSSAALAVGALALAYKLLNKPEYIAVAKESADYYYTHFQEKGLTYGGPAEALQAPDSESSFAFVESYTVLYEVTGEKKYLKYAEDAAAQFATWVMPYNFEFPGGNEFSRLGMHSVGSVFANAQNKHSAPAVATMSGDSLIKLFQFTGKEKYIELAADIAHGTVQYYSREDRPVYAADGRMLPAGFMCERVNTSDWESRKNIGNIFYGMNWCTNCGGLSYAELPGIYVRKDINKLWVIDHVKANLSKNTLEIFNPCKYMARVKVLVETENSAHASISAAADFKIVELQPKERVEIAL